MTCPADVLEPARVVAAAAVRLGEVLAPLAFVVWLPVVDLLLAVPDLGYRFRRQTVSGACCGEADKGCSQ